MPRLTHPITGRTTTTSETRARVLRKRGWIDDDGDQADLELNELGDFTREHLAEFSELATQGAPPANPAGDGTTETPEV